MCSVGRRHQKHKGALIFSKTCNWLLHLSAELDRLVMIPKVLMGVYEESFTIDLHKISQPTKHALNMWRYA